MDFSDTRTRFLTYCESHHMLTGGYPKDQVLMERFNLGLFDLEETKTACRETLTKRGLPPMDEALLVDEYPPQFILACNVLSTVADKRATATKLKEAGLTSMQWQGYLRNPKYRKYYEDLLSEAFGTTLLSAKQSLARNVESGDLASIKHLHEITGVYRPNQETQVNLGLVIAQIMEILARFIEPKILQQVADEVGNVINTTAYEAKELSA